MQLLNKNKTADIVEKVAIFDILNLSFQYKKRKRSLHIGRHVKSVSCNSGPNIDS